MYTGTLQSKGPSLVAISPNAHTVAIIKNNQLCFYDALNFKKDEVIDNVCNGLIWFTLFSKFIF